MGKQRTNKNINTYTNEYNYVTDIIGKAVAVLPPISPYTIPNQTPNPPLNSPPQNTGTRGGRPPGVTGQNARLPDTDLVTIVTKGGQEYKLYKDAAIAYNNLKTAAAAAGYDLDAELTSAYRDYAKQQELYNNRSRYPVAKPGQSNHGWGRAIDVNSYSRVHGWLKTHCVKYGWYWFGPRDRVHFTYGYNESNYPQLPQLP